MLSNYICFKECVVRASNTLFPASRAGAGGQMCRGQRSAPPRPAPLLFLPAGVVDAADGTGRPDSTVA